MLALLRHLLLLALALVLQATWLPDLQIGGVFPDLVLLVVVFIALLRGHVEATFLGFAAGLCQDVYTPHDLGLNALTKAVTGFAVGISRGGFVADSVQVQLAVVVCAVLAHDLVYYAISGATALPQVPFFMVRFSLGRALYTAALGLLVAWSLRLRRELLPG